MQKQKSEVGWNFNNSYATLPDIFYTKINPTPVSSPRLVILNETLANTLGLNYTKLLKDEEIAVLAGNKVPDQALPIAQAYAGHQFGHFTMLGDGRAVLLGEQITPTGVRYDIQLKGSGKTPYSRGGDGRATLGPMLREYIISEAMFSLGIPTTRSLAVVTTGQPIMRREQEQGAILTRVAASHIRIGTFQYIAEWGSTEDLKTLADYSIARHYPELKDNKNKYLQFYQEVIKKQATLIAKWQLVGFIHGVMNTDNITISGETIDYGPCAFMDSYSASTVFSSIDRLGRYAYGNQPSIAVWNLARFAEALLPLLDSDSNKAVELAQESLQKFQDIYSHLWLKGMCYKLGLFNEENSDIRLIETLLAVMENEEVDYTNTFLDLTFNRIPKSLCDSTEFKNWYQNWQQRLSSQNKSKEEVLQLMKNNNPAVIPRNFRVEEALKAANEGDLSVMEKLLYVLSNPYAHVEEQKQYQKVPENGGKGYKTYCGT